jgi:XTP/dITP diphosphohydrolase
VRRTEHAIAAGRRGEDVPEELDVATLGEISEEEWRAYWPLAGEADLLEEPDDARGEDTEPAPDGIPEPAQADVPEDSPEDVAEPAPEDVPTEEAIADDADVSVAKFTA